MKIVTGGATDETVGTFAAILGEEWQYLFCGGIYLVNVQLQWMALFTRGFILGQPPFFVAVIAGALNDFESGPRMSSPQFVPVGIMRCVAGTADAALLEALVFDVFLVRCGQSQVMLGAGNGGLGFVAALAKLPCGDRFA